MTILPKKKTSKDKSQQDQSEHHSSSHMQSSSDGSTSRMPTSSSRSRMRAATTQQSVADISGPSSLAARCPSTEGGVSGMVGQQPGQQSNEGGKMDQRQSLKRRHGRTSPHSTPYGRQNEPHSSSSSSSSSSSARHQIVSKSSAAQRQRRRQQQQQQRPAASSKSADTDASSARYNSEDEYEEGERGSNFQKDYRSKEEWFEKEMKKKLGFEIKKMEEDGSCLFRAVADQVYGDQNMADEVRRRCMDYMCKNRDYFSSYVTEDFAGYIRRKRLPSTFGNNLEMQAMAEMYNRTFVVYEYSIEPMNTFQAPHESASNPPIRVSYHQHTHYNSVVDPFTPTAGVGLGMPSLRPGLADKNLLEKACKSSENEQIEQQMLNDKLMAADRDFTEEELIREISDRSLQEYLNNKTSSSSSLLPRKSSASSATTVKSEAARKEKEEEEKVESKPQLVEQRPSCSERNKPSSTNRHQRQPTSSNPRQTASSSSSSSSSSSHQQAFQFTAGSDWVDESEEMSVLQRVLIQSQQEYYEQLKQAAHHNRHKEDEDEEVEATSSSSASCSRYPTN